MENNKKSRGKRKEITGKIVMVATQRFANLPTQEGWTAEGKVIPISDRHLESATVSHTHFTPACHIHKPTNVKTQIFILLCPKYKHEHTETSTYNLCRKPVPLRPHHHLSSLFPPPLSVSLLFTSLPFVSSNGCSKHLK